MSYSFFLRNIPNLKYKYTIDRLDIDNVLLENYGVLDEDGMWPKGVTHLYIDGKSTRSLEVEYESDTLCVRIFSSSSPADYKLATKLAEVIATQYRVDIEPEEGEVISYNDFASKYDATWCTQHSHSSIDMVLAMARSSASVLKIGTPKGEYVVGANLLGQLDQSDNIHTEFVHRIQRFNYIDKTDTFVPSLMVLHNSAKTREVKITTFGESVTSLLTTKADLVGLMSFDDRQAIVKTEDLLNILKEDITWISEDHYYLDGFSGDAWQGLFEKALEYHLDDLFVAGRELSTDELTDTGEDEQPLVSFQDQFSEEQWEKLLLAPYLILLMVSFRDGKLDQNKLATMGDILTTPLNPLLIELVNDSRLSAVDIISRIMELDEDMVFVLQEIGSLVNSKLPAMYAVSFKAELYMIAQKAIDASHDQLNPSQTQINEDQKVLQAISYLLNIDPEK